MANILVLYDTKSGRTKSMAELVAQGAKRITGMKIKVVFIGQCKEEDILWCDAMALGSPTNLGSLSWRMKKFWDDLSKNLWGKIDGKIASVFSSSGSYGGGNEIACLHMLTILMNYGFLVFGVTDYAGPHFSPHYGAINAGTADTLIEKENCMLLGQRLAEWTAYYIDQRKEEHPLIKKIVNI